MMQKSLRFFSVDFDVDVVLFQMFNFAHFIKPFCNICASVGK